MMVLHIHLFFFDGLADHRNLHSFPTRRSSDLTTRVLDDYIDNRFFWGPFLEKLSRCVPDRKSTRLNSSHEWSSYAVFCLKKKKKEYFGFICIIDHNRV